MSAMSAMSDFLVRHAQQMRQDGWWQDISLDQSFQRAVSRSPDKTALVAYRTDREVPQRWTYGELAVKVARAAGALRALGIGAGDVVAVQLPNWWEFVVVALACQRVGAVVNPLMHIFREREMAYMLGFSEAKMLVAPKVFRGFDHEAMAASLQAGLPALKHVVVVDGAGDNNFTRMLLESAAAPVTGSATPPCAPDALAVLMFTSGTTGEPKGVMHSANTLTACTHALASRFHLSADDVLLGCSPMGHMTGYAAVFLQSNYLGATLVLQDIWEPKQGVGIMVREGVTHTAASTPFLVDISDTVSAGATAPALRTFLCGGAPIPPVQIERASGVLKLQVCSLWGMTESLSSTLTEPERAAEKSSSTDGRALSGAEVKVVDMGGQDLPLGETGRLMVRGAQMFMGYYKRPELEVFDAQGWFDTGDLAYMDAEGYIRINGRTKDVLIRGGENVPVFEIESLLLKHPAVAMVALVGYPDERLGERGCAFVVTRPGQAFDLAAAQAWMAENKVAKQYWPERVECQVALPTTPTGKVQKFALREQAKTFGVTA
jgi:cyclohexanecarboxylate-CoA ligase